MRRHQSQTRRRAELNAALIQASATGDVEGVDQLLREGADVRADGNAALKWASRSGHVAVVYRLLQVPGMSVHDVVAQDNYALKKASENGHLAVVDRLLQVQGITADDVRAEDNFALKSARRNGHAAVVNRLSDALREIEWASRNYTALQMRHKALEFSPEHGEAPPVQRQMGGEERPPSPVPTAKKRSRKQSLPKAEAPTSSQP